MKIIDGGITSPKGYTAAGIHVGIKKAKKDLALIYSERPASIAGAFTQNVVRAAPVLWDEKIVQRGNSAHAILINSGNANACTGEKGEADCAQMAALTAKTLGGDIQADQVCVCSTGVIGVPLPMETIEKGITAIVPELAEDADHADDAAHAILTTDTFKKEIAIEVEIAGRPVTISGIAKGSGMIHPDMATMLSFIVTDASISSELLQKMVGYSIADSYNMISVDGDTSTNDTVLVMANGASDTQELTEDSIWFEDFKEAFDAVHLYLAKSIVRDGEGAGKFLEASVMGTASKEDARIIAKSIITSNLVKTAFFGEDANWGRILCAAGYSGVSFDPLKVSLKISSKAGSVTLLTEGTPVSFDEEYALSILKEQEIIISMVLEEGSAQAAAWGCDLSYEYVKINGEYRT